MRQRSASGCPRSIREAVRREHKAWVRSIDSSGTLAALIGMLCDCSRFGNPDWDAGDADHHHWRCTAGIMEYWCSRHPDAASDWLAAVSVDPPPEPVW